MPCKICLRHDQVISLRKSYSSEKVTVFAPFWVKRALLLLGKYLGGITFNLYQHQKNAITHQPVSQGPLESFTLPKITSGIPCCCCNLPDQSLITLQKIARNETYNVTGKIDQTLYPDIKEPLVLYSLRDLVRQTVICGIDESHMYGGYRTKRQRQEGQRVYICDLAALQFQQPYNSGRLVLIRQNEKHRGILDDFIFENVVGERKPNFEDIQAAMDSEDKLVKARYLPQNDKCFFDTEAYARFVQRDVIFCGKALCTMVKRHYPDDKLNFKFLKYGTGFFGGEFSAQLEKLILPAVLDGLEKLFEDSEVQKVIRCVELPFYNCDPVSGKRVDKFEAKYAVKVIFSTDDALKYSSIKGLHVATTNCGDNHAAFGNEMNFGSVDAAIAENLESKGHIFCPNINLKMSEEFIEDL